MGLTMNRRLLAAGMLTGLAIDLLACSKPKLADNLTPDDMTIGAADAPVTVIEYASVTCHHCAEFNKDVLPQFLDKYVKTGKVRYVYREFLTAPQRESAAGILLARCAGRDKYFQVIDAIMRAQPEMFEDGKDDNALMVLQRIGVSSGLTEAQVNKCITDPAGLARIQANVAKYDKAYNIKGTPTFFVNGRELERRTGDIKDFDKALAPLLETK